MVGFVSLACASRIPADPPPAAASPEAEVEVEARNPEPPPASSAPVHSTALGGQSVGVAECDEYLLLYGQCLQVLAPAIEAGERRSLEAERGWLVYVKDTPEGVQLPEACREMTLELQNHCASRD